LDCRLKMTFGDSPSTDLGVFIYISCHAILSKSRYFFMIQDIATQYPASQRLKRLFSGYLIFVALLLSFLFGYYLRNNQNRIIQPKPFSDASVSEQEEKSTSGEVVNQQERPEFLNQQADFDLYWTVWKNIKNTYVDNSIPETQLFYGSLQGMVSSLQDPYSVFLTPDITKQFQDEMSGRFEGIGAHIAIKNDVLVIVAPLPGTPAEKAGLKAGDYIIKIDGKDTTNMSIDQAVTLIRGLKGTKVKLSIFRESMKEPQDFEIERDTIKVASVRWKVLPDQPIGYIEINHFNEQTLELWNQAVQELLASNLKGIILDLRNNPGGFLDTAIQISSDWIPEGTVVSEVGRLGAKRNYDTTGTARLAIMSTVVLINGASASASEIVSGALQDYKKAKIIGETSFGKGSVQDYQTLPDTSSLKLTVAKWFTPLGRGIDKQGIQPDIEVKLTKEDFNANLDPQLDVAQKLILDPNYKYEPFPTEEIQKDE